MITQQHRLDHDEIMGTVMTIDPNCERLIIMLGFNVNRTAQELVKDLKEKGYEVMFVSNLVTPDSESQQASAAIKSLLGDLTALASEETDIFQLFPLPSGTITKSLSFGLVNFDHPKSEDLTFSTVR